MHIIKKNVAYCHKVFVSEYCLFRRIYIICLFISKTEKHANSSYVNIGPFKIAAMIIEVTYA